MKKIIPFKKEILFKTNVEEITSISLEHTLHVEEDTLITGEFIVSGEYKIADSSVNTETFSYNLPFDIHMDDHYLLDHVTLDINDFYYEILNNHSLVVNIEVCIDKLQEKPLMEHKEEHTILPEEEIVKEDRQEIEEKEEDVIPIPVVTEEPVIPVVEELVEKRNVDTVTSLFGNLKEEAETYTTYHVHIVREGDNLEGILLKYKVSKEEVEVYNDIENLKLGDKLIIPASTLENQ